MGHFNLNLLNNQNHNATVKFLDGLYSHLFFPLITLPFRITSHTATLIDNIFSNHVFFLNKVTKALVSNYMYRPISILPCFSVFGANIIYNPIINYLTMTSMSSVIINMALEKIVPLASCLPFVIKALLLLIEENMLLEYF